MPGIPLPPFLNVLLDTVPQTVKEAEAQLRKETGQPHWLHKISTTTWKGDYAILFEFKNNCRNNAKSRKLFQKYQHGINGIPILIKKQHRAEINDRLLPRRYEDYPPCAACQDPALPDHQDKPLILNDRRLCSDCYDEIKHGKIPDLTKDHTKRKPGRSDEPSPANENAVRTWEDDR